MVFLSPWLLWALCAAVIPVVIHLVNRWRHKSLPWAAMEFILKATRERKGRKKLLHYLILTLRTLAIIALVLAAARPLLSSFIGFGSSGAKEVVLLLDRSASMGAMPDHTTSLQDRVPVMVADTMEKLNSSRIVLLDSVTLSPLHVSSPETLPELSVTKTTDTEADFPALLASATRYLSETGGESSEIWIATDMQASDWQVDSPRWKAVRTDLMSLPSLPAIRLLAMKQRPQGNRNVRVEQALVDGSELLLDFTISRTGAASVADETMPVTVSIDNAPVVLNIPLSGETTRLIRKFPLPEGRKTGYGYITIPHDDQPGDDQFFFVFTPPRPISILVVSNDRKTAAVLQNMAAPPGLENRKSSSAAASRLPEMAPHALVIWQGDLPQGNNAAKVAQYMENGGTVLFLPDDKTKSDAAPFLGLAWLDLQQAGDAEFYRIANWDHHSSHLRDSAGNQSLPLGNVQAIRRTGLTGQAETIAAWEDGTPAVSRKPVGKGEACFLTSIPDYKWSNLAEGHLLLPLIQRLTEKGSARQSNRTSLSVGDPDLPVSSDFPPRRLDHFDANTPGHETSSPQTTAGVYALGSEIFCVNRPKGEDDPVILTNEAVKTLLPEIEVNDFSADSHSQLVREAWKLFLLCCLVFLILEALLSLPSPENKKNGIS